MLPIMRMMLVIFKSQERGTHNLVLLGQPFFLSDNPIFLRIVGAI